MDNTLVGDQSSDSKKSSSNQHVLQAYLFIITSLILLAMLKFTRYLAFHTFIELLSVILSYTMLIVSISTYAKLKNNYFLFLGITYSFIGGFDLFHAMAFQDIGIFAVDGVNVADQLWIAARYMQGITIVLSAVMLCKEIKIIFVLYSYTAATMILLYIILIWQVFPDCYLDGIGYTPFKIYSEYIISGLLLIGILALFIVRRRLEPRARGMMLLSVSLMLLSELIFAVNTSDELVNAIGHVFRLLSYYVTYQAIFHITMAKPYKVLENKLNNIENELEAANEKLNIEIKERKRMEEVLFNNENCYDILIKNSKSAIIIHNGKEFIFANNSSAALTGMDNPQSLIGKNIYDFIHPHYVEKTSNIITSVFEKQKDTAFSEDNITQPTLEIKISDINGEFKDVEIEYTYIVYKGSPAILSVINDVSPKRKIEELKKDVERNVELLNKTLEQNKLIGDFTANVSHELRTPLNIILGSLQVLNMYTKDFSPDEPSAKILNYLNTIKQNSYRLLKLVNNLIDSSIADSGFLKLKLGNYDIINVIEDVVLSVVPYVESKGINLSFDTQIEEKVISCDPDKLERIMLNLLSNAVKFSKPGDSIFVNIEDGVRDITISVMDTGTGIPEDKLELIFDRFKQVDKSLARNRQGSGIGLYLVKSLVKLHKGSIEVKSVFGKGTEFRITIPAELRTSVDAATEAIMYENNHEMINIEFSDI